jgi:hypothetical protein
LFYNLLQDAMSIMHVSSCNCTRRKFFHTLSAHFHVSSVDGSVHSSTIPLPMMVNLVVVGCSSTLGT